MKKLEKRAIICVLLAFVLIAGIGYYVFLLARDGSTWASFPANQDVYSNGYLSKGAIYDTNGKMLLKHTKSGKTKYNQDYNVRKSTLHAVGDKTGNISTGANQVFASNLVGYNFVTGTFSTTDDGRRVYLTIDADLCATANEALNGQNGTVGVYNYETGEIVCMVSSPNYDPLDPPTVKADDSSGIYLNKLLSSRVVPGSTFKVITSTAAIENLDDLDTWTYTCTGKEQYGTAGVDKITCPYAHGTVTFEEALAKSCNCAFGKLTERIGADKMEEYTKKAGLMDSYNVDGVNTVKGNFEFPSGGVTLAWSGIGQYQDQVNPCSLMVYMGAIAGGGKAADPRILDSIKYTNGFSTGVQIKTKTKELIDPSTAAKLGNMLHNNVVSNYGESNYPGLDLCAKSGTAEISDDQNPHSWFTGYIRNEGYPYAFVVMVENGGWGSEVAGSVANTVMQKVVENEKFRTN